MRLTTMALLALLAGCGGNDTDDLPPFQSQPQARTAAERAAADTTAADTAAADTARGEPGQNGGAVPPGAASPADRPADSGGDEVADAPSGDERLYTVQVAAFTDPASAEQMEEHLRSEGMPVWTSVAEQGGRTFYRLRVGVVPTVSDARRLGSILTERYDWPVWVAPLTPADRLPANAIESTRRVLGSD